MAPKGSDHTSQEIDKDSYADQTLCICSAKLTSQGYNFKGSAEACHEVMHPFFFLVSFFPVVTYDSREVSSA